MVTIVAVTFLAGWFNSNFNSWTFYNFQMRNIVISLTILAIIIIAINSPPVFVRLIFIGITVYIVYKR